MKLPSFIQKHFPRSARASGDELLITPLGTLRVAGDLAHLALATGSGFKLSLGTEAGEGKISVRCTPLGQGGEFERVSKFDLSRATEASLEYQATLQQWRRMLRPAAAMTMWSRLRWAVIGAAATISAAFAIQGTAGAGDAAAAQPGSTAQAAAQALAVPVQAQPVATAAQAPQQPAVLTDEEAAQVEAAAKIEVSTGRTRLLAFSDPLCPACQDLERQAASFDNGEGFAVMPVAYKQGSRDLVARILCSSDPRKAWKDALQGMAIVGEACDAGYAAVDANIKLFESLGGRATPTLVAPNGTLAEGSADTPVLARWIAQNQG